ncbi:uncharacterized protein LOC135366666 [Ornithodoros turicata]|uniref:uncharacterized protein LOC135366666 n=1 Tax=Ornithodoros turicata TaxID=34597 RepID=UPI003138AF39
MATESGPVKRCQTFCMRVSMLVALVAVLLGAMCLIMLRFPEKDLQMASTDMRLVEAVSNVWCGGQEFVSAHPFSVYRVSDPVPPPVPAAVNHLHHVIDLNMNVPSGKFHYLRYYLLPGSNVTIDVIADGPGGTLHAVRGEEELRRCIRALQEEDDDDDDDDDFYEEGTLRRRQPSFYRWAMKSKRIAADSTPNEFDGIIKPRPITARLSFRATAADLFYVLIVNENRAPQLLLSRSVTNFKIRIDMNRTVFGITPQDVICLEQTHCVYHVHFGAEDRLILHIPRERDAGNSVFTITTSCRPRVFFYALLFILIPILFLVFLGAVIRAFSYLANTSNEEGKYLRFRLFRDEESLRRRRRVEPTPEEAVTEEVLVCHLPGLDPPRTPPPCYTSLQERGDAVPENESLLQRPRPVVQPPRYSEVLLQEQLSSGDFSVDEPQATTSGTQDVSFRRAGRDDELITPVIC